MKFRLISLSLLSAVLVGSSFAQQPPAPADHSERGHAVGLSPEDRARFKQAREAQMANLNLAPEQAQKIKEIDAQFATKMREITSDKNLSPQDRAKRRAAVAGEAFAARNAVLTPEQRATLKESHERAMKLRNERLSKGPNKP